MTDIFQWPTGRPLVMGILNVTPDSFSDGGRYAGVDAAIEHGCAMMAAGADMIDVGGESTRPGSVPVSMDEERQRVLPVILKLCRFPISIDTTKADVAEQALAAGAKIVNDISALRADPRMVEVVRNRAAGIVLTHMQGTPATMQQNPLYSDVVAEVRDFLAERIAFAESHGVKKSQIAVDPGIGFGKSVEHNLQLLAGLKSLCQLGCPIVVGASRKSFIGKLLNRESQDRLAGSLAAGLWAVSNGAGTLRVHDVAETVDTIRLWEKIQRSRHQSLGR